MQTTQLAHGKITNADTLTIELIEPPGMPAAILFRWLRNHRSPHQAANSKRAAAAMQTLAAAVTELAALRVRKRL
jgi:hypothetical protein